MNRQLAAGLILSSILSVGCSDATKSKHPTALVGVWKAGPTTLTLEADGEFQLAGPETPAFLAFLRGTHNPHWEVVGGRLKLTAAQWNESPVENEFDFSFEEGGNVIVINKVKLRRVKQAAGKGS